MTVAVDRRIESFLESGPYAVVGASTSREKYGNKVFRAYLQRGEEVYPVNPNATEVEGREAYPCVLDLPVKPRAISVITPPRITERIVENAARAGVHFVWMQPGAESDAAIDRATELGMEVIAGGPCFLVVAGYREGS